jgi:DNA-directed RNA polymerase subunit RPC12/RpoP
MTITLHCLDCGFRFSLTLGQRERLDAVAGSLSCGHCGSRRWAAA